MHWHRRRVELKWGHGLKKKDSQHHSIQASRDMTLIYLFCADHNSADLVVRILISLSIDSTNMPRTSSTFCSYVEASARCVGRLVHAIRGQNLNLFILVWIYFAKRHKIRKFTVAALGKLPRPTWVILWTKHKITHFYFSQGCLCSVDFFYSSLSTEIGKKGTSQWGSQHASLYYMQVQSRQRLRGLKSLWNSWEGIKILNTMYIAQLR